MSDNNSGWESCMSWRNNGCYRRGTVEMMNSPYVIVAYLMLEELVSVLENSANMGLPVPSWLRSVLKQVSDVANSSTPKAITKWLHDKLGLNIDDDKNKEKE